MKNDYSLKNIVKIVKNSLIFKRIPDSLDKDWYAQIGIGVILWLTIALVVYQTIWYIC